VPIGAVIVLDNTVIAKAHNLKETKKDATAHAELLAIQDAQRAMNDWRLTDCTLYTSLEPCVMCAGAILHSRLKKVVYAAPDLKWGGFGSKLNFNKDAEFNHKVEVVELYDESYVTFLQDFFRAKRK
jgi:tRNA(adenine34) deaminase